jgi:hypothetical protein
MKTLKVILLLTFILSGFKQAKADPPTLSIALNNVTKAYLGIKNALVSNNGAMAQSKAMEMITALNSVPDKEMTADEHTFWFKYLNKLEFDSRHINESRAIDHQREHFASLSDNFFAVIKAFKLNTNTLYRQYCPMKKLYWVSETATIKNPYYGNGSMTECGVSKETLKANTK